MTHLTLLQGFDEVTVLTLHTNNTITTTKMTVDSTTSETTPNTSFALPLPLSTSSSSLSNTPKQKLKTPPHLFPRPYRGARGVLDLLEQGGSSFCANHQILSDFFREHNAGVFTWLPQPSPTLTLLLSTNPHHNCY